MTDDPPEPTIYDAVKAPAGYDCHQWHDRDREKPKPCENDGEVLFVYDSVTSPDEQSPRNCIGCMQCAPVVAGDVRHP